MTATAAATTPKPANTLKWAAWLAFAYAAVVIVNTTVLQALSYRVEGLTRAAAFVAIGVGLLRRARWAQLFGLGLSLYFLGFSFIDFGRWIAFRTPWLSTNLPRMSHVVTAVATALLAALLVLLLHPRSRAMIRSSGVSRSST
jgi:hypothetical protein